MKSRTNLEKKRNNKDDSYKEIGKMKLKTGSVMERVPYYNDLFNNNKMKVFPLQSFEEIVTEPSKFNHTKRTLKNEEERKKAME